MQTTSSLCGIGTRRKAGLLAAIRMHTKTRGLQLIYGILFLQVSPAFFSDGTAGRKDMVWVKQKKKRREKIKSITKTSLHMLESSVAVFVSVEDEIRASVPPRHALLPATSRVAICTSAITDTREPVSTCCNGRAPGACIFSIRYVTGRSMGVAIGKVRDHNRKVRAVVMF